MQIRVYLSNIRRAWPISRQEALLDERCDGWRNGAVYRDILPPRKRMAHGPADLTERAALLRPTSRREEGTVVFPSVATGAWTTADLLGVIGAILDRGEVFHAMAENICLVPGGAAGEISRAAEAFISAISKAEGIGPAKGGKISGEKREADALARCETIRDRWHLPTKDWTTKDLCLEADVARVTADKHLGKRKDVQKAYANRLRQAEVNRKRRKNSEQG